MEKIVEIVGRQLRSESTAEEEKLLSEWIEKDPANAKVYEEIKWIWDNAAQHYEQEEVNVEEAWSLFSQKRAEQEILQQTKNNTKKVWLAAAAVVMAMLFGYLYISPVATDQNEVVYTAGTKSTENIQLPDGSAIWLNKNAAITYAEQNGQRHVVLTGEAFFDVAHDEEKPFVIRTGKMNTQVLGTSFNIRHQTGEPTVVSVASGKVKVYDDRQTVLLTKGEESLYHSASGKLEKNARQDPNFLSWKTEKLVFENSTIDYVIVALERHYGHKLKAQQSDVDEVRLTASFDQQPLDQVLDLIYLTTDVQLTISNP